MTTNWWDLPDEEQPKPWTLADIYADLGTLTDVAQALDIKYTRISMWQARKERVKPPKPVRSIARLDLYSIQEWRDWFAKWLEGKKPNTAWTHNAQKYTPPRHKVYGNEGLAAVIRAAAAQPPGGGDEPEPGTTD